MKVRAFGKWLGSGDTEKEERREHLVESSGTEDKAHKQRQRFSKFESWPTIPQGWVGIWHWWGVYSRLMEESWYHRWEAGVIQRATAPERHAPFQGGREQQEHVRALDKKRLHGINNNEFINPSILDICKVPFCAYWRCLRILNMMDVILADHTHKCGDQDHKQKQPF